MAINKKTYIEKSNTIIKNSTANTGLNPILELNYGTDITRAMIFFNCEEIKNMIEDKTYPNISKLKHVLKMTNASSINTDRLIYKDYDKIKSSCKERATSFDLIFFLIPKDWDNGRGFDFSKEFTINSKMAYNEQPSNWYQNKIDEKWDEIGIFSNNTLNIELDKFINNEDSIVIGIQHFDIGNENIELDITNTVNKFILGELPNYGIGIAFSPNIESLEINNNRFVSFFTNRTHSFYVPYVETIYDDYIKDDRNNFYLDKDNRLYFYSFLGGKLTNLDELPTCNVNGSTIASKQATKGVYYIDLQLSSDEYEEDAMIYDLWSNIIYKGKKLKDVELYFTTVSQDDYFDFGLPSNKIEEEQIIPVIYGIDNQEKIKRGDIRKLIVECKIPYTSNQEYSVDDLYYRLYVKNDNNEITVIDWSHIEKSFNSNYFMINTNELIPSIYYIDIKCKRNDELLHYYNILEFEIINETKF